MLTEILLITVPLLVLVASIGVFVKGYLFAKNNDDGYTILSALENPIPVELEAKQLLMEYAEAVNGRYSEHHKMQHAIKWMQKLDQHVKRNQGYYQEQIQLDEPVEQLAQPASNVVSLFDR